MVSLLRENPTCPGGKFFQLGIFFAFVLLASACKPRLLHHPATVSQVQTSGDTHMALISGGGISKGPGIMMQASFGEGMGGAHQAAPNVQKMPGVNALTSEGNSATSGN